MMDSITVQCHRISEGHITISKRHPELCSDQTGKTQTTRLMVNKTSCLHYSPANRNPLSKIMSDDSRFGIPRLLGKTLNYKKLNLPSIFLALLYYCILSNRNG